MSVAGAIAVLAVDAEPESLAAIRDALAAPNCRVFAASSGTEALRQILKNEFALIVLAANLPDLSGFEVAMLMRQVSRASHVPLVFLTAPGDPPRPELPGDGLVDSLEKPVDPALLQSVVAGFARACGRSANAEIGKVGVELETVIRERTASLIRANDDLRREVARRERAEAALLAARLEAEAANSAKSEFLANMSHEIRTPMNGVVGLLELLQQTQLSAEQREYLGLVRASAGSLLSIINDILDFSKIEAGSLELETIAFSLRETVGDTMKALALEASRKGLELACEVAHDVPDALLGDPVRLRQIITNLAGNAVKFTASGEVVLSVAGRTGADGEAICEFAVRDTGIGIPEEKRKAIFAPFFQGDTSTTRVYGGTGLGLTIAARLVEIMGGRLEVESRLGEGSLFRFSMRFARQVDAPPLPLAQFGELRVLTAVHPVGRRALAEQFRHWQVEVVQAEDTAGVLARIAELRDGKSFDLVLLDDGLPGTDAYELAAHIRPGASPGVGAVAVLGSIAARQRHAAQIDGAGFVSLTKPVKQSELLTLLSAVAGRQAGTAAPPATISLPREARTLDILLVEDNAINARVAQQVLSRAGHRVAAADNGAEALAAVALKKFDVVLMDVQMPGMDGLEATRTIRERERRSGGHVPVIALTAHAMVQHRERCLKAGMDGFLVKPIRPQELLDAIDGIERAVRRIAPTAQRRTLDRAALLERTGGDPRLLAEVTAILGDRGTRLMDDARAALRARNAADCARLLHTLTGMFASLAAEVAAELAAGIEDLAVISRWTLADVEFTRLEWEVERVVAELGSLAVPSREPTARIGGRALAGGTAEWN
jgi:signal transduction histidine kinase/AmiR/NasT family two-component response regulator